MNFSNANEITIFDRRLAHWLSEYFRDFQREVNPNDILKCLRERKEDKVHVKIKKLSMVQKSFTDLLEYDIDDLNVDYGKIKLPMIESSLSSPILVTELEKLPKDYVPHYVVSSKSTFLLNKREKSIEDDLRLIQKSNIGHYVINKDFQNYFGETVEDLVIEEHIPYDIKPRKLKAKILAPNRATLGDFQPFDVIRKDNYLLVLWKVDKLLPGHSIDFSFEFTRRAIHYKIDNSESQPNIKVEYLDIKYADNSSCSVNIPKLEEYSENTQILTMFPFECKFNIESNLIENQIQYSGVKSYKWSPDGTERLVSEPFVLKGSYSHVVFHYSGLVSGISLNKYIFLNLYKEKAIISYKIEFPKRKLSEITLFEKIRNDLKVLETDPLKFRTKKETIDDNEYLKVTFSFDENEATLVITQSFTASLESHIALDYIQLGDDEKVSMNWSLVDINQNNLVLPKKLLELTKQSVSIKLESDAYRILSHKLVLDEQEKDIYIVEEEETESLQDALESGKIADIEPELESIINQEEVSILSSEMESINKNGHELVSYSTQEPITDYEQEIEIPTKLESNLDQELGQPVLEGLDSSQNLVSQSDNELYQGTMDTFEQSGQLEESIVEKPKEKRIIRFDKAKLLKKSHNLKLNFVLPDTIEIDFQPIKQQWEQLSEIFKQELNLTVQINIKYIDDNIYYEVTDVKKWFEEDFLFKGESYEFFIIIDLKKFDDASPLPINGIVGDNKFLAVPIFDLTPNTFKPEFLGIALLREFFTYISSLKYFDKEINVDEVHDGACIRVYGKPELGKKTGIQDRVQALIEARYTNVQTELCIICKEKLTDGFLLFLNQISSLN
jgi:hypothetical protein